MTATWKTAVDSCWQLMTASDSCYDISIIIYSLRLISMPNFSSIRWSGAEILKSDLNNSFRQRDRQPFRDKGLLWGQSQKLLSCKTLIKIIKSYPNFEGFNLSIEVEGLWYCFLTSCNICVLTQEWWIYECAFQKSLNMLCFSDLSNNHHLGKFCYNCDINLHYEQIQIFLWTWLNLEKYSPPHELS